jgi:solute carrier family 35 protein E1
MTFVYVALWYALNIGYNITNKDLCNGFPLVWTVGTTSLGVGLLYVVPLWATGLRAAPKLAGDDYITIAVIALLHAIGHFGAVVSMSLGAVSFTHIVKAAEPVFSTVLSGLLLDKWSPWQVNLSLVPVILGVVIASVTISFNPFSVELGDFNVAAFSGAMISNVAFALRSIYMKRMDDTPDKKKKCRDKKLTADNIYAVYTIFAFFMSIPLALYIEGSALGDLLATAATPKFETPSLSNVFFGGNAFLQIAELHLVTGLFFYMYNEASSLALGNLDGVAHAVCNTVKRVVIMIAMSMFDKPLTAQKWAGAGIAIGGTLLYTLVKNSAEKAAAKKTKGQ